MASRKAQKRRTAERKARQQEAWRQFKQTMGPVGVARAGLQHVGFGQLRQGTKAALAALLASGERP